MLSRPVQVSVEPWPVALVTVCRARGRPCYDLGTMSSVKLALLQLHLCVVLWGFTSVLGRLVTLNALSLVLWRMALTGAALMLSPRFVREVWASSRAEVMRLLGVGLIVCLHWVTFYLSVKLANASVTASCMALCPVFAALLEPYFTRRPAPLTHLVLALLAVPGMWLVVGGTPHGMLLGLLLGTLSAAVGAWFTLLNAQIVVGTSALTATGVQMLSGAAALLLLGALWPSGKILVLPGSGELGPLLFLVFGCTLLPYVLWLSSLKTVNAFTSTLICCLEPVYAIALARVLLGGSEALPWRFYWGAAWLLAMVLLQPFVVRRAPSPS